MEEGEDMADIEEFDASDFDVDDSTFKYSEEILT